MAAAIITRDQMLAGIVKQDRTQPIEWDRISDDLRWWIGGQHDSDGCTTVDYNHGPRVMVVKAENGWGCLEVLKTILGGVIHKHADETEEQQARKSWTLSGRSAIDFCKVIKDFCYLKKPQLVKMCEYPIDDLQLMQMVPVKGVHKVDGTVIAPSISLAARQLAAPLSSIYRTLDKHLSSYGYSWSRIGNPVSKTETQEKCRELEKELRDMKHVEHQSIPCTLPSPYVAGIADGDGSLYLVATSNFPRVSVGQKYSAICDALKRQYGGGVYHRQQRGFSSYTWQLVGQQEAQKVIREILPLSD